MNTFTLRKLSKLSFVLMLSSLPLMHERIYLETPTKVTSMHIRAPGIIDQNKFRRA